jgi:hypothetical protein
VLPIYRRRTGDRAAALVDRHQTTKRSTKGHVQNTQGRNDPKEIQAQNKMIVDDAIEQRVAPRFARPIQFVASMKRL